MTNPLPSSEREARAKAFLQYDEERNFFTVTPSSQDIFYEGWDAAMSHQSRPSKQNMEESQGGLAGQAVQVRPEQLITGEVNRSHSSAQSRPSESSGDKECIGCDGIGRKDDGNGQYPCWGCIGQPALPDEAVEAAAKQLHAIEAEGRIENYWVEADQEYYRYVAKSMFVAAGIIEEAK